MNPNYHKLLKHLRRPYERLLGHIRHELVIITPEGERLRVETGETLTEREHQTLVQKEGLDVLDTITDTGWGSLTIKDLPDE